MLKGLSSVRVPTLTNIYIRQFATSNNNGLLAKMKRRGVSRFQIQKPEEEETETSTSSNDVSDKVTETLTKPTPKVAEKRKKTVSPKIDSPIGSPFKKLQGLPKQTEPVKETPQKSPPTIKKPQLTKEPFKSRNQQSNNRYNEPHGNKKSDGKEKPIVKKPKAKIKITIPGFLSVANLATILKVRTGTLLLKLQELGFENMTYNHILDNETAALIADEYGYEVSVDENSGVDLFPAPISTDPNLLKPRAPIVTIMGHVDHGKTTILDYLRKSSIVDKEFGGITQHIGAFSVKTPKSKKMITFLDTPGHSAFLKMRERGANITDIVVLVVAADDSVMPQTKEAIKHAKNAGVQMIVAINKCDKPQANPAKVVADLAANEVDVEDYGGEIQTVRVSGKTGLGMEDLEEAIVALAEIQDLKLEDKNVPVEGWVIESQVKKGMGSVATFLVTRGTLKKGMVLVAGTTYCKVKSMANEFGARIESAGPSIPVEIVGWKEIPVAGDSAIQAKDESLLKKVVQNRMEREELLKAAKEVESLNEVRLKEIQLAKRKEKLEELNRLGLSIEDVKDSEEFAVLNEEKVKEAEQVYYIIKADVSGSSEAILESISGLGNEEVESNVLYEEVGPPTESDVERASSSGATILCFNVKIPKDVASLAAKSGVQLKDFTVIYHLIEDVMEDLTSRLPPIYELKVKAKILIRQIFEITVKKHKVKVAGSRVEDGNLKRTSKVRVMRGGEEVWRGELDSLKREKDEVDEIKKGGDCGISFKNWDDFQENDVIEVYEEEKVKRYL